METDAPRSLTPIPQEPRRGPDTDLLTPLSARITCLIKFHYEVPGIETSSADDITYSERLSTEEQAYQRSLSVGEEWEVLDLGWIDALKGGPGCSFLCLKNSYQPWRARTPSPQELLEAQKRIIEVGMKIDVGGVVFFQPLFVLPLGFGIPFCPIDLSSYRIRCKDGKGRYSIFAVPEELIPTVS